MCIGRKIYTICMCLFILYLYMYVVYMMCMYIYNIYVHVQFCRIFDCKTLQIVLCIANIQFNPIYTVRRLEVRILCVSTHHKWNPQTRMEHVMSPMTISGSFHDRLIEGFGEDEICFSPTSLASLQQSLTTLITCGLWMMMFWTPTRLLVFYNH